MNTNNEMTLRFCAVSKNESFARSTVAAFCLPLNPSISELNDIKTAVSEAVTNAVVHAYAKNEKGKVEIEVSLFSDEIEIKVKDFGMGIDNIEKALEPFYTTKPEEERSGMGFTVMQAFMDKVEISSIKNHGTIILMKKKINSEKSLSNEG